MQSIREAYRVVGKAVHRLNARWSGPRWPSITLPLVAPRSTAATQPVDVIARMRQRRPRQRNVQTGRVTQIGRAETKTALATFSGSTSRFSSVREA